MASSASSLFRESLWRFREGVFCLVFLPSLFFLPHSLLRDVFCTREPLVPSEIRLWILPLLPPSPPFPFFPGSDARVAPSCQPPATRSKGFAQRYHFLLMTFPSVGEACVLAARTFQNPFPTSISFRPPRLLRNRGFAHSFPKHVLEDRCFTKATFLRLFSF